MNLHTFVQLDGYKLSTQIIDFEKFKYSKTILVFLHEALGSIQQWRNFPQDLCASINLPGIIIERRGYGQSDPMNEERDIRYLHNYAVEIKKVFNELLTNQKVIIIGHSDGGSIGLLLAHYHPENILGLVTLAAHTYMEECTVEGIRATTQAFEEGKLDGLKKFHGDKTNDLFYAWSKTRLNPTFMEWDIRFEIQPINVPVLAIQGKEDQYGSYGQLNGIRNAAKNYTELNLEQSKHHPHLEKTNECLTAITKWINTLKIEETILN